MSRTTDANLDCAFVENAHVFDVLTIGAGPPGCTAAAAAFSLSPLSHFQEKNCAVESLQKNVIDVTINQRLKTRLV